MHDLDRLYQMAAVDAAYRSERGSALPYIFGAVGLAAVGAAAYYAFGGKGAPASAAKSESRVGSKPAPEPAPAPPSGYKAPAPTGGGAPAQQHDKWSLGHPAVYPSSEPPRKLDEVKTGESSDTSHMEPAAPVAGYGATEEPGFFDQATEALKNVFG